MFKPLCLSFLLLSTFAIAQASKPATPFPSPLIVAKGRLPNQTATIPTTTVFTPTQTGLYRFSVYGTIARADPTSQVAWAFNLQWTDDAGPQAANSLLFGFGCCQGQFTSLNQYGYGGQALPFEAKAGMPITYTVTQGSPADSSAYSLYYTLERLE